MALHAPTWMHEGVGTCSSMMGLYKYMAYAAIHLKKGTYINIYTGGCPRLVRLHSHSRRMLSKKRSYTLKAHHTQGATL